jgi:hypothetical protein
MGAQRSQSAWQRGQDVASAAMFKGVQGMLSSFAQAGQATAANKSFFKFG